MDEHILADKVRHSHKGMDHEMDFVYGFMNSEDIAMHCREIRHRFTLLQSVYLISRSYSHTLEEKQRAFRRIMDDMPDEELEFEGRTAAVIDGKIDKKNLFPYKVSLKCYLEKYMSLQNRCLGEFFDAGEGGFYEYSLYAVDIEESIPGEKRYVRYEWFQQDKYYKTAKDLLEDVEPDAICDDMSRIKVCKRYPGKEQRCIGVIFNCDKEAVDIDCDSGMSYEESDIMWKLADVCFVCPVPFEKGDVVCASPAYGSKDGPFVYLRTWYEGMNEEKRKKYLKSASSVDMTADGYFQRHGTGSADGQIYWECMHDYLSLEYYRGSYGGNKRILKTVSNFLKGELGLDHVLNAYHIIMNEENVNRIKKGLNIMNEGLCLAGLSKDEERYIQAGDIWEFRGYCGLFGFCVGDALGVPVEFSSREERKMDPVREMRAYGTHRQPAGTWSDDTSLMLCLIDAVNRGYSIQKVAENFIDFYRNGAFTPHGEVFDIGISTREAIEKMCDGELPVKCGGASEMDNGNGSLMRVLPLAFYGRKMKGEQFISLVEDVSSLTHRHKRSMFACIFYVKFASRLADNGWTGEKETALDETIAFMREYCSAAYEAEWSCFDRILSKKILNLPEDEIRSTGYVVDTLEAALWAFFHGRSYREVVLKAVNLGGDTDTIAAVAGGLAGIYHNKGGDVPARDRNRKGYMGEIPEEWFQSLAKREELNEMFQRFYKVCNMSAFSRR